VQPNARSKKKSSKYENNQSPKTNLHRDNPLRGIKNARENNEINGKEKARLSSRALGDLKKLDS
jgi:hypothetical protein